MVEDELKIEVSEDINAASMTASMSPRTPAGSSSLTRSTKATLVHPALKNNNHKAKIKVIFMLTYGDWQISLQSSGVAHAT